MNTIQMATMIDKKKPQVSWLEVFMCVNELGIPLTRLFSSGERCYNMKKFKGEMNGR